MIGNLPDVEAQMTAIHDFIRVIRTLRSHQQIPARRLVTVLLLVESTGWAVLLDRERLPIARLAHVSAFAVGLVGIEPTPLAANLCLACALGTLYVTWSESGGRGLL